MKFVVYGRNLSPYTRRVLIWARLQGHEVEQRALTPSDPGEFAALCALNPSGRVPILEREDGSRLFESAMICDWLDSVAAADRRLLPQEPEARLAATQACGLANSAIEKAVAWVYEGRRPEAVQWDEWRARVADQAAGALDALEAATPAEGFFGGARPNGVDIYAVTTLDFIAATHPAQLEGRAARLKALSARANADPVFAETKP